MNGLRIVRLKKGLELMNENNDFFCFAKAIVDLKDKIQKASERRDEFTESEIKAFVELIHAIVLIKEASAKLEKELKETSEELHNESKC